MSILAIDPGPSQSGWVFFDAGKVAGAGILANDDVLGMVETSAADMLAIEMIASYGMPVGQEVFDTCVWVGMFKQAWRAPKSVKLIYRSEVKMGVCHSMRAKDGNVRQALIDMLGPPGTKKAPGPTYGVTSHAWQALGVAVTAANKEGGQS